MAHIKNDLLNSVSPEPLHQQFEKTSAFKPWDFESHELHIMSSALMGYFEGWFWRAHSGDITEPWFDLFRMENGIADSGQVIVGIICAVETDSPDPADMDIIDRVKWRCYRALRDFSEELKQYDSETVLTHFYWKNGFYVVGVQAADEFALLGMLKEMVQDQQGFRFGPNDMGYLASFGDDASGQHRIEFAQRLYQRERAQGHDIQEFLKDYESAPMTSNAEGMLHILALPGQTRTSFYGLPDIEKMLCLKYGREIPRELTETRYAYGLN